MAEKSLDIVINARDHASRQLGVIGKSFQTIQNRMAGLTGAITAIRVGVGLAGVAMETFNFEQVLAEGNVLQVVEAQRQLEDATNDVVRSIPFIGHAIAAAMKRFSDREHIDQALANIGEVQAGILKMEQLSRQWARETALERARIADASESEIARIRFGFAEEDRQNAVDTAKAQLDLTDKTVKNLTEQLAEARDKAGGIFGPPKRFGPGGMLESPEIETLKKVRGAAIDAQFKAENDLARLQKEAAARATIAREAVAKQAAADEKKAAEKRVAASERVFDSLRSAEEKELAAARAQGARLVQDAFGAGISLEVVIAANEQRIADIRQKHRDQEKAARDKETAAVIADARKRQRIEDQKSIEDAKRLAKKRSIADQELALRATLLRSIGKDDQAEEELIRAKFKRMRTNTEINKELIDAAEQAELSEVGKGAERRQGLEVQAFTARFLTRGPVGDVAPAWTNEAKADRRKQIDLLRRILAKTGTNVREVGMN